MKFMIGLLNKVSWTRLSISFVASYTVSILMYLEYFKPRSIRGGNIEINSIEELFYSGIVLGLIIYFFPLKPIKEVFDKKVSWDRRSLNEKNVKDYEKNISQKMKK